MSFKRYINECPMIGWILTMKETVGEKFACVLLLGLERKNRN